MSVNPIPENFHTITPYMVIEGAAKLLEFMEQAFSAQVLSRSDGPGGKIMNAEIKIGDSMLMIADSRDDHQPMPSSIYLYVEDTDSIYSKALNAGATSLMEPADQFYGDRNAGIKDPSGNHWWIATHIEDVSPEEMEKRMHAQMVEMGK